MSRRKHHAAPLGLDMDLDFASYKHDAPPALPTMRLSLIAALVFCAGSPSPIQGAPVATFYVATNGNDTWSGTVSQPDTQKADGPFATLVRARDAARAAKVSQPRIVVRGGDYFLAATLELTAADSGLTIEAASREQPVLYAGRRITGWHKDGEKCWAADLPEVAAGKWDFRMLVVDGEFCPRARLPETGALTNLSEFKVPWMSTTGGGWQRKPTEEELTTMKYRPGDLGPWLDARNAEVTVYHMWDESLVGVASLDDLTHTVKFNTPAGHPPGAFGVKKYVIWNVREGLRQPGQWYLDRSAGKVVYWPRPGQNMAKAKVIAPTAESVIRIRGSKETPVKQVTLKRLKLAVTNTPLKSGGFGAGRFDGAVSLSQAEGCRLEGLTVENVGGQAIKAGEVTGLTIEQCEIRQIGACGIQVKGKGGLIANNHVHHVGLTYPSAIAVTVSGDGNEISHNEVHDTPYSAITAGGHNHRLEANLIHHAMKELHDGAGIYITFCSNVVVRGNVIRNIVDTGGYGASAYYLDEQARNCLVENNLSLGVGFATQNHMATNNVFRGNVFVSDGDMKLAFPKSVGYTLERNIFYATGELFIRASTNGIVAMPNNLFFSRQGKVTWERLEQYGSKGKTPFDPRDGSLIADPLFENGTRGDLRFKAGSPAAKLGIRPVNSHEAGRSR